MATVHGTRLRIDGSGRIILPKPVRDRLGLKPGTELEIVDQHGGLLLRTVQERPNLVKVEGVWVHQGSPEPGAQWDRVIEQVRDQRIADISRRRP